MDYRLAPDALADIPFKAPLLTLPALGGKEPPAALDLIQTLFRDHRDERGLIKATTLFSTVDIIPDAWRYEMEHGIILVLPDLSALLFCATDDPDAFNMLPLVFALPRNLPLPKSARKASTSGLMFTLQGNGSMQFGIQPIASSHGFLDIEAANFSLPAHNTMARKAMDSIELETFAWTSTFGSRRIEEDDNLPVALSKAAKSTLPGGCLINLRRWLCSVCTYASECIGAAPNPFGIHIRSISFAQEDGSIHANLHVDYMDVDDALQGEVARHLAIRIKDLIRSDKASVPMNQLFPRVLITSPEAADAEDLAEFTMGTSAFALLPLSNHERLDLEARLGLKPFIANARVSAA